MDIKQWWCAACCGPKQTEPNHDCGFCGEPVLECARLHSDYIRDNPDLTHDGAIEGTEEDDPEDTMTCGGSGFWCSGCGRFWPQDSCGNISPDIAVAIDGAATVIKDSKVYCVCGKQLARVRNRN